MWWKKVIGVVSGFFSLSSAFLVAAAVGDLVSGNKPTETGVLVGLVVFFGGVMVSTGYGAYRMLRDERSRQTQSAASTSTATSSQEEPGPAVDIALEARILAFAAKHDGRVTPVEIAIACSVAIDDAMHSLDGLMARGHADLHITPEGEQVYVLKGFMSHQQKQQAEEIVRST